MLSGGTSPEPCLMTPPLQHGGQSGGEQMGAWGAPVSVSPAGSGLRLPRRGLEATELCSHLHDMQVCL